MAKEKQEYDYEGDMAMSQLKSIIANAQRMHDMLKVDTNLPEWVQSKITLAEDYITTAANYMQGEMKEQAKPDYSEAGDAERIRKRQDGWQKTHDAEKEFEKRAKSIKHAKEFLQRYKGVKEEVAHSVHVKTYDSQGEKQMNSPEFKKHIEAHNGKLDYASDKGAAFKFASHSHAAAFHRGVQSKFKELDSEHDMHEDVAMGTGPVNVAANVADPQNKKLFGKPAKRKIPSFKSFAKK